MEFCSQSFYAYKNEKIEYESSLPSTETENIILTESEDIEINPKIINTV